MKKINTVTERFWNSGINDEQIETKLALILPSRTRRREKTTTVYDHCRKTRSEFNQAYPSNEKLKAIFKS